MFRQVLTELLEIRKYTNVVFTAEESNNDSKYLLCTCFDENETLICVFGVFNEQKLNVHSVKECILIAEGLQSVHCIIVYSEIVTPVVKKLVLNTDIRIELFRKKELGYNITKHVFVPKHTLATVEEKKALTKYIANIPQIKSTDAVVKFMGFKVGDIVRIDRRDGSVAFRIVV